MLKELIQKDRDYLNQFFDQLDSAPIETLLEMLTKLKGTVFFTGVGKSGLIAKKIAMTMTSTGTRALFISPTDALHGDIGIASEEDVFILLSKSGESDELLNLIPSLRSRKIKLVAVTSNNKSRLSKASDLMIILPVDRELCPFDMAPTISTTVQMIFGDILSIALMQLKDFSQNQFIQNHPAGRIGKRITMKVQDLMVKDEALPLCRPENKLVDILVELSDKKCGCVIVVNEKQELQGIFTDGDLRRALKDKGAEVLNHPLVQLMTRSAKFIEPHRPAWEAMQMMEEDQKKAITVLPVLQDKKVIGLIKLHDILQSGL